jgi:hypothetical protein
MVDCPYCGASGVSERAIACPYCGVPVAEITTDMRQSRAYRREWRRQIWENHVPEVSRQAYMWSNGILCCAVVITAGLALRGGSPAWFYYALLFFGMCQLAKGREISIWERKLAKQEQERRAKEAAALRAREIELGAITRHVHASTTKPKSTWLN